MKQKIYKSLMKGTNLFLILLLIDYITTLFSLNETKRVVSRLGIIFDHVETDTYITTKFSIDIKLLIYYAIVLLLVFIIEFKKNDKPNN